MNITTNAKLSTSTDLSPEARAFKQTAVGLIPADWNMATLQQLCTSIVDGTHFTPQYVAFGVPFYSVENVTANNFTDVKYISPEEHAALVRRCRPERGDILLTRIGSLGDTRLIDWDAEASIYVSLALLKLGDQALPEYVYRYTKSSQFVRDVESRSLVNATPKKINMGDIGAIPIPLPPTTIEQAAIAEALSDVDGLIEALEKLIAKKQAIKQAAMQQLLTGKTRLPGFTRKWTTRPLSELAVITMGQSPQSQFYNLLGDGLPLIQGNADIEDRWTIDRVWTTQASKRCSAGDLLLTVRAPVGAVGVATKDACLGRGVCGLKPLGNMAFLFHALVYAEPRWRILEQGSTFTSANSKQVGQFALKVPEEQDEQVAIATILSDMDAEIESLEGRREKTRQIKQGMMQQLLTGRIRLVKPEPQAPAAQTDSDGKASKPHSWAFNEAVVISTLAKHFGKEDFPLGRKRYTKLSYLLHRHAEQQAEGYLKKAAGPYNPKTKYGGPERIALESSYIREHKNGPYTGFVAADNIAQAEGYFEKWYGPDAIQWLNQFRFKKNDDLELLATVDMAAEELRAEDQAVDVDAVKAVIRSHPEWKAKLDRAVFSNANIAKAIEASCNLFATEQDNIPGGT